MPCEVDVFPDKALEHFQHAGNGII
jgi:hypothetical protein